MSQSTPDVLQKQQPQLEKQPEFDHDYDFGQVQTNTHSNLQQLPLKQPEATSSFTPTSTIEEPECYTLSSDSDDESDQSMAHESDDNANEFMRTSEDREASKGERMGEQCAGTSAIQHSATSNTTERKYKHVHWPKCEFDLVKLSLYECAEDEQDDFQPPIPPAFHLHKNLSLEEKRRMDIQWEKEQLALIRLKMEQEEGDSDVNFPEWRLVPVEIEFDVTLASKSTSKELELRRHQLTRPNDNESIEPINFEEDRWTYLVSRNAPIVYIALEYADSETADELQQSELDNEVNTFEDLRERQIQETDWNKENMEIDSSFGDDEQQVAQEDEAHSELTLNPTDDIVQPAQTKRIDLHDDIADMPPYTQTQSFPVNSQTVSTGFEYGSALERMIKDAEKNVRYGRPCSSSLAQSDLYISSERLINANKQYKQKEQELADLFGIDTSRPSDVITTRTFDEIYHSLAGYLTPGHDKAQIKKILMGHDCTSNANRTDSPDPVKIATIKGNADKSNEQVQIASLNSASSSKTAQQLQRDEVLKEAISEKITAPNEEILESQQSSSNENDEENDRSFSEFCMVNEHNDTREHAGEQVSAMDDDDDEEEKSRVLPMLISKQKRRMPVVKTEPNVEENGGVQNAAEPQPKRMHEEEKQSVSNVVYGPSLPPHYSPHYETLTEPVAMEVESQLQRPSSQLSTNSMEYRISSEEHIGLVYCWYKSCADSFFLLFEPKRKQLIGRVQSNNTKITGLVTIIGTWYTIVYSRCITSNYYVSIKNISIIPMPELTPLKITAQWNKNENCFETTPCAVKIVEVPEKLLGMNGFLGTFEFWCWIQPNRFVFASQVSTEKLPQQQQNNDKEQNAIVSDAKQKEKERMSAEKEKLRKSKSGYDRDSRDSSSRDGDHRDRYHRHSRSSRSRARSRSRSPSRSRHRSRSRNRRPITSQSSRRSTFDRSPAPLNELLHCERVAKTRLPRICEFFSPSEPLSSCTKREKCMFLHDREHPTLGEEVVRRHGSHIDGVPVCFFFFGSGKCIEGSKCNYAHGREDQPTDGWLRSRKTTIETQRPSSVNSSTIISSDDRQSLSLSTPPRPESPNTTTIYSDRQLSPTISVSCNKDERRRSRSRSVNRIIPATKEFHERPNCHTERLSRSDLHLHDSIGSSPSSSTFSSVLILHDEFVAVESDGQQQQDKRHISPELVVDPPIVQRKRSRSFAGYPRVQPTRTRTPSPQRILDVNKISRTPNKDIRTPNKGRMTLPSGYVSRITNLKLSEFVQDCPFFVRHGACNYGKNCKFSHGDSWQTYGYRVAQRLLAEKKEMEERQNQKRKS